ncbi:TetR/AcrR family transcriptional regulator [Streptomyces sp. NPDC057340]|uniref:TetR/AcrR family transcriptional regulator n=1 Tax=Streptomyces sp. NPDC057340 TaxID=3346103 RepID=UPI00362CE4D7
MATDEAAAPVKRPRVTAEREREVLAATLRALSDTGYEALSMDDVATRAHCSKATLYRLWHSKAGLVSAAVRNSGPVRPTEVDTGSLRGDLITVAARLARHATEDSRLYAALSHAILTDDELAAAVRTALFQPDTEHVMRFIDRAVERGELTRRPAAAEFLPQTMRSLVMSRPALDGTLLDSDYLARFIDDWVMPALLHT